MAQNRFPNAKLDALPQMATVSDMFLSVLSKKSDVIFLDDVFYKTLAKNNPDALKRVPDVPPVFVYGSYYSVKRGEHDVKDMIALALRRMIDDGRLETIVNRYGDSYKLPLKNYDMAE